MTKIRTSFMMDSFIGLILTILTFAAFYFSSAPFQKLEYSLYDPGLDSRQEVTDFVITRMIISSKTQTGMGLGTPGCILQEQVAVQKVGGGRTLV
jgi:hypothetical protein